jgi:predicted ArsR family transcriptional regulator
MILEMTLEQKWKLAVNSMGMFMQHLLVPILRKFGERGYRVMEKYFREQGEALGPLVVKALNIEKLDAEGAAKIIDYQDTILGVEGRWVERTPRRAVKVEHFCPMYRYIKDCPQFCDLIIWAWGEAQVKKLNPKAKVLFPKRMVDGDETCEVIIEIEY